MRTNFKLRYLLFYFFGITLTFVLLFYALRNNVNLFYSPEEVFLEKAPLMKKIRIGGVVKHGSVENFEDLNVRFVLTDYKHDIFVNFQGILPDLFREHQGVVVLGELLDINLFKADQVLAKHDENYIPIEVKH